MIILFTVTNTRLKKYKSKKGQNTGTSRKSKNVKKNDKITEFVIYCLNKIENYQNLNSDIFLTKGRSSKLFLK